MQYPIIDSLTTAYMRNQWTGLNLIYGKNLVNLDFGRQIYAPLPNNTRIYIYSDASFELYVRDNLNSAISLGIVLGYHEIYLETGSIYFAITEEDYNTLITGNYKFIISLEPITDLNVEYTYPETDFPHKLKLPLPHYFPHPVIDSLKRASEGNMTNKDIEILRHYLTPIGIGGI